MPDQSTRNIIDYALDENGIEFRKELYASIHDRVAAHIEAKKQEIAGSLVGQNEEVEELGEQISRTHLDNSIYEFGFNKTAKAIQDLHDKDHITTLEAKKHLHYLNKHRLKPKSWKKTFALEEVEELGEYSLEDYSLEEIQDFMQTEDFEQLDELSKKKLGSYIEKSTKQLQNRPKHKDQNMWDRKSTNRSYGAAKAIEKYIMSNESYDSSGAYEKHDPKHPDFAKNYKKYKATNPQGQLSDFIADMKKQK